MKFEQLKSELDNGVFRRLYIFTGPEKGVLHKYLKRVGVTGILQDISEALPLMRGSTLFESSQTLAVREGFEEYEYSKLLELCGEKHRLVLLPESIDQRKKLYKEGMPAVVEFVHFSSEQLAYYVQGLFSDPKPSLSDCQLISVRCNNDVLSIDNACHKLISFRREITKDLILKLVTPMPEDRMFDLADAIMSGKKEESLKIVSELYQLKTAELQIIVTLYNQFKTVLQIQHYRDKSDFELSKITGLSPWIIEKKRASCRGVRSDAYFLRALRKFYKAEQDIKFGRAPTRPCLYSLILGLL